MATFYNQATLSYNGYVTNSNITVGEITDSLTITKTAVSGTYRPNDSIVYTISITNAGGAVTDATVTDDLGAYTFGTETLTPLRYVDGTLKYFVNGVLTAAPTVTAGPPLTITGVDIPAGGNALLIYETETTGTAPLATASTITNTATVSGAGIPDGTSAEATVTVEDAPVLSITKSLSPTSVANGGEVTYTFVIQNTGNIAVDDAGNMTISDTFTPALNNITVVFNGQTLTENTDYTYNQDTGAFATLPGALSVPAATFTQGTDGNFTVNPGVSVLTVTGTI